MKLLVGTASNGPAVFPVRGDEAYDPTARFPRVGSDLMALIGDPGLAGQGRAADDLGPATALGDIIPALPVARPLTIICLGPNHIEGIGIYASPIVDEARHARAAR